MLRFNLPILQQASLLAPFGFAGIGWNRLDIVNAGDDVTLPHQDHRFVVPLGAGLARGHRGFFSDARFTYRQAFEDEMFGGPDMSQWNVAVHVGAEF
jgi:hypothetical protein